MTELDIECQILSELWMNYRDEEAFQDFIEYNDIGLPLAHYVADGLIRKSALEAVAITYISDTYNLLFEMLGMIVTHEYTSFEDLLAAADSE